jgi:hypothetical protein
VLHQQARDEQSIPHFSPSLQATTQNLPVESGNSGVWLVEVAFDRLGLCGGRDLWECESRGGHFRRRRERCAGRARGVWRLVREGPRRVGACALVLPPNRVLMVLPLFGHIGDCAYFASDIFPGSVHSISTLEVFGHFGFSTASPDFGCGYLTIDPCRDQANCTTRWSQSPCVADNGISPIIPIFRITRNSAPAGAREHWPVPRGTRRPDGG